MFTVPSFNSAILLTVNVTFEPSDTVVPVSILCFNTTPLSFVVSSSYTTLTVNPISVSFFFASASFSPITYSIVICFTPVLTYTLTVSPAFNSASASGSCLITYPASTLLLDSSIFSTTNSCSSINVTALS